MNRTELLGYANSEAWGDYHKKYLVPYWKQNANSGKWQELVTANFAARHAVDGTITKEKALATCRERSNNCARDFTSTVLSEKLLKNVVKHVSDNKIKNHGNAFKNYKISVDGLLIDAQAKKDKGYIIKVCSGSVEVGIDANGLINHLHGVAFKSDEHAR